MLPLRGINQERERERAGTKLFRQGEHFFLSFSLDIFHFFFIQGAWRVRQSRENGTLMEADTQTLLVW
jgi:hypothetical protein